MEVDGREQQLRALQFAKSVVVTDVFIENTTFDIQRDAYIRAWESLMQLTVPGYTQKVVRHTWDYDEWAYLTWRQKLARKLTPKFLRPVTITITHVVPSATGELKHG